MEYLNDEYSITVHCGFNHVSGISQFCRIKEYIEGTLCPSKDRLVLGLTYITDHSINKFN